MESELAGQASGVPTVGDGDAISLDVDTNSSESGTPAQEGTDVTQGSAAPQDKAATQAPKLIPEEQLRGLQSAKDREIHELRTKMRTYESALQTLQEMMVLQQRWADMPEEERAAEQAEYQRILRERQFQEQERRLKQLEEQLNKQAQPLYAAHLAQQYGVPVEDLVEFPDPVSMEAAAKKLSVAYAKVRLHERKASGVDQMESAGTSSPSTPWENLDPAAKIDWYFNNTKPKARR